MSNEMAKEVAKDMGNFLNSMSPDYKDFVDEMRREHPTIQQAFSVLCLRWFKELSDTDVNRFDARNERSKEVADKIKNALSCCEGDNYWANLPMI